MGKKSNVPTSPMPKSKVIDSAIKRQSESSNPTDTVRDNAGK